MFLYLSGILVSFFFFWQEVKFGCSVLPTCLSHECVYDVLHTWWRTWHTGGSQGMCSEHAWAPYATQLCGPYNLPHNRPHHLLTQSQPGKGLGHAELRPKKGASERIPWPGAWEPRLPEALPLWYPLAASTSRTLGQSMLSGVTSSFAVGTRRTGKEGMGHSAGTVKVHPMPGAARAGSGA